MDASDDMGESALGIPQLAPTETPEPVVKKAAAASKKRKATVTVEKKKTKVAKVEKRDPGNLDANTRFMAALANSAYVRKAEHKVSSVVKAVRAGTKTGDPQFSDAEAMQGFELDEENSSARGTVWVNHKAKKVVTAFRGTQNVMDVAADVSLILGLEKVVPLFRHSVRQFENVVNEYPDYQHALTGHSLGGAMALYAAEHAGKKRFGGNMAHTPKRKQIEAALRHVEVFNPGAAAREARRGLRPYTGKSDEDESPLGHPWGTTIHRIEGDVVSLVTSGKNNPGGYDVINYKPLKGSVNAHTIRQFFK
jgi:hypothetical protein